MDKIKTIESSLRCYAYGWTSWLPIAGIPFIVLSMLEYQRARLEAGSGWNPARRYLIWGLILAMLGGFLTLVSFGLLLVILVKASE